ncbi:hypothetical protein [Desulfopila sp. IMCC35008]|uniref:hypothetical protein n=1 Tax=Desulfopila sp. IMCC35008 TaxID=2653858 RepID=UPI0013D33420|nr:hypothetical protein [Desulfopila sp. IMCC35008]
MNKETSYYQEIRVSMLCMSVLLLFFPAAVSAQDGDVTTKPNAEDVANELANPNTSLGFLAFPFDYISYDGDLSDADHQDAWKLSFQPSFPYPLAKDTNFFLRPLIPVILDQPVLGEEGFDSKGVDLGDISFDAAVGKSFSSGWELIGGVVGTLPTATDDDLGLDQWLLGPELFVGRQTSWGFLGALFSHQWDVAGEDNFDTSITGGQYFYTINLPDAWQIQAQPTWSYDHEADSDNALSLPLGVGVAKTVVFGSIPWKFSLQYWYYIVSPDDFGPDYQIRFQVAPVVPLPW